MKETHVQNPASTNPFIALAQEDAKQKPHQPKTQQTLNPNLLASLEIQQEIQTKMKKRDASPLLLAYPSDNTQHSTTMETTEMEERNHSEAESLLEGVNLQDMIPQDLIQKIEKALQKEINNATAK